MASEQSPIIFSSTSVYYWKKPNGWSDRRWTRCQWRLMKDGTLFWDTYKWKGCVNIRERYDGLKICSVEEKEFFNGVPYGIEMTRFVFIIPMTPSQSARFGGVRERWFAVSTLEELNKWTELFAKVLRAEDTLMEMVKWTSKEKSNTNGGEITVEAWRKFVKAIRKVDGPTMEDTTKANNSHWFLAMSIITSNFNSM